MAVDGTANYYDILAAYTSEQDSFQADTTEDSEANEFARFRWFWEPRVINGNDIDAGQLGNYGNKLSQYFENELCTQNANPSGWELLGPKAYSEQWMGAVTAILADPNENPLLTIYAGTTSSGLWKTTDGGQHWSCITDSARLPVLGVCSVAKANGRLWIGTGALRRTSYSAGVFWSDDEGTTWHRVEEIGPVSYAGLVRSIEIYDQDVYIAQERRLWHSSNGGATFEEITPGFAGHVIQNNGPIPNSNNRFTRVARYEPQQGPPVLILTSLDYATEGNGANIYASESNGAEWVHLSDQINLEDQLVWPLSSYLSIANGPSHWNKWHGWSNGDPASWQYDGPYNQDGFLGTLLFQPTQQFTSEALVFYGNNQDLNQCTALTHWDTPYKVEVVFRKDACAQFKVYLAGELDDLGNPIMDNAQEIYSTWDYAGATDNISIPPFTFDANSNYGSNFLVVVGFYPGIPNPCLATDGIRIDKIRFLTDAIEVSSVDVINDLTSPYTGFHIAAKGFGGGPLEIFSGQSLADLAFHGSIPVGDASGAFNGGYQNFEISRTGTVYTANTCGVFSTADDGSGVYSELTTGWNVFSAPSCYNNGSSADPQAMHADFRCMQLMETAQDPVRIVAGNDGGVGYLGNNGTWSNLNGSSLPIQESYGFGVDEFAQELVGGAQDNGSWRYQTASNAWEHFDGGDGGHSHVYNSRDSNTQLESNISNGLCNLDGEFLNSDVNLSISGTNGLGRPSSLFVGLEPRVYVGQDGLESVSPSSGAVNLVQGHQVFSQLKGTAWGLGIHPKDDDIIFFGVNSPKPGWEAPFDDQGAPSNSGGRFYRTFTHGGQDGEDWEDITWKLFDSENSAVNKEVFRRFGMQDVEIDPDSDPNDPTHLTLYVAMNGVPEDDGTERVFKSTDGGDSWQDMSAGLPGFPVLDLECQPGSGGILYAATDVGVFVYDPLLHEWLCFNDDLPVCMVSQVRVNSCTGQLYASTMGRGYWRTDLYRPEQASERVLTATETFTGEIISRENIRIAAPNTLTIQGDLLMYPDRRVIVDPGARLVLDGGLIDSYCQGKWDGVEVRGNANASQVPQTNQGYLELRGGARIEHAEIAIRLYRSDQNNMPAPGTTGGVLKAYGQSANPVFIRNCTKGLHMLPYENRPGGGNEINNRTSLAWTVFETDEIDAEYCARLEDVSGVSFSYCTFRDNASSTSWYNELRPNGIEFFSSKITVRNSIFWRLRSGIEASSDGLLNPAFIRNNTFDLCHWGILLDGVHASEVTRNDFIIPHGALYGGQDPLEQTDPPLGLYLHTCEGYEVEENHFESEEQHAVGLVVTDNSSGANQFYKNTFNGLLVGSLLQGDNRDVDGQGLQCLCNDYGLEDGNVYKIAITWGGEIAQFQGTPANFNDPAIPAGNRFYPECLTGADVSDLYVEDDGQLGFTYLRHSNAFCDPVCRTDAFVSVVNTNQNYQDDTQANASCPSQLGHGHYINDHLLKYALHKQAFTDLKLYLDGQLDGGDTQELLTMIHDASVNSFTLRLELLAASPRLTDRVMIDAINRTPAMDPWHLAQVLLSNSPLTPDVLLTLDRSNVLPLYRDMVAAAQTGGLSLKSMLEAELAGYRMGMEGPRFDAVRYYLERDTSGWPLDSVLTVIGDPVVPSAAFNVAGLQIARRNWSAAQSLIDNAANNGLDEGSVQVLTLHLAIGQDPSNAAALVLAAAQDLAGLAPGTTAAGAAARCLLAQYASATFEHPLVLPGNRRAQALPVNTLSELESTTLEVFPNPASTTVRIVVKQNTGAGTSILHLIDAQGRNLREWRLGLGIQLLEEEISSFATGQYCLRLLTADGIQRTTTFQITR
jgi:hypothetical protein